MKQNRRLPAMLLILALLAALFVLPASAAGKWAVPEDGLPIPDGVVIVIGEEDQNDWSSLGYYYGIYTLTNITSEIASLQPGDILYYQYRFWSTSDKTDYYVLITVDSIEVTGTTAVIHGTDVELTGMTGSGDFGTDNALHWALTADGTLTISGSGSMPDWLGSYEAPWDSMRSSIRRVIIQDGVTGISSWAFKECTALTTVSLADSVASIGQGAFRGCSALVTVTGGNGVTAVEDYAFYGCKAIISISLPAVVTIGNQSFYGCVALSSCSLSGSLTQIGEKTFYNCSALQTLTVPACVTEIGEKAFGGCSALEEILFKGAAPAIGENAFQSDYLIAYYPSGSTAWTEAVRQDYGGTIFWVPVDNAGNPCVETVASGTCGTNLTWTLNNLGLLTISGTGSMENWQNYTSYVTRDNVTTATDPSAPEWADWSVRIRSVAIESGVTSTGSYAFSGCIHLTAVSIPDTVTSIGRNAFAGCTGLTAVTIPASVKTIGQSAFSGCTALIDLTISSGLQNIGAYAFFDCQSLSSVSIPASVVSIGEHAFGWQYTGLGSQSGTQENFSISGYTGSAAERYASRYSISFESLGTVSTGDTGNSSSSSTTGSSKSGSSASSGSSSGSGSSSSSSSSGSSSSTNSTSRFTDITSGSYYDS